MDSEPLDSATTDAPPQPVAGPGARLRAAREALRLELTHVAAETRIPLRHLEAIEANNFETLPSRAYAIGFSRTFAKAVGLDEGEITEAVRAELADGSMRRGAAMSVMEPGDPARLPSKGLAWATAAAVLVLGIGAVAFYSAYFGAGSVPGSLLSPEPAASASAVAAAPSAAPAPATSGAVVLTALEEGVWLRLYEEEGGARLIERTLKLGEAVTVPATAADPRLNTGRPDALGVTIGGQTVAKISDRPETISGVPVSATALLARADAPAANASAAASGPVAGPVAGTPLSAPRRTPRRSAPAPSSAAEAAASEAQPAAPVSAPAPAQASEAAPAPGR